MGKLARKYLIIICSNVYNIFVTYGCRTLICTIENNDANTKTNLISRYQIMSGERFRVAVAPCLV